MCSVNWSSECELLINANNFLKNPIIFNLELYKLEIEELIVLINYVNIKQDKLKIDNR